MFGELFLRQIKAFMALMKVNYSMVPFAKTIQKLLCALMLVLIAAQLSAQPSADNGKTLFRNYCASCHNKDMKSKATGPALGGSQERWAEFAPEDLYSWIRNSQAMIKAGHPRATVLWEEYKPTVMTAYPNLTDDEIGSILLYIDQEYTGAGKLASGPATVVVGEDRSNQYNWLYYILFGVLAVLAIILTRIIVGLNKIAAAKDGVVLEDKSLMQSIFTKGVRSFLLYAAIIIGAYILVTRAIGLGRQQNYEPDQPIKFSHAIHAGENGIDCQYCHDGARRSKHAVIPATNTCMNCHSAIQKGSNFGTAELTKIYASVGYDPITGKYIENYDKLTESEIEAIYKKWITESYLEDEELTVLDRKGEKVVQSQWSEIKKSLTNEQKSQIQGPIEWVRIHNLPDHVYFNHAQHVTVGQVACQDCHGKVEEMEVVSQYAPLSMGWCINCHRQTEVKFASNDYYKSYELYHEQLAKGDKSKITVEDIGGLECQKCHY